MPMALRPASPSTRKAGSAASAIPEAAAAAAGGGGTLTLAQPDSLNGPSYNSFGQSYGGDYQSANQVDTWRTQAFTPPSNSGSSSGSGSK